ILRGLALEDHLTSVIALGENADELVVLDDEHRADVARGEDLERLEHRAVGRHRDRARTFLSPEQIVDRGAHASSFQAGGGGRLRRRGQCPHPYTTPSIERKGIVGAESGGETRVVGGYGTREWAPAVRGARRPRCGSAIMRVRDPPTARRAA